MKIIAVIVALICLVVFLTFLFMSIGSTKKSTKPVRNFVVRFDAASEKYYITNQLETYDEPVTNSFGFRVMYKDKLKADFVAQKLNA